MSSSHPFRLTAPRAPPTIQIDRGAFRLQQHHNNNAHQQISAREVSDKSRGEYTAGMEDIQTHVGIIQDNNQRSTELLSTFTIALSGLVTDVRAFVQQDAA